MSDKQNGEWFVVDRKPMELYSSPLEAIKKAGTDRIWRIIITEWKPESTTMKV